MKTFIRGLSVLLLLGVFPVTSSTGHTITKWPENKKAVVSLSFDDGCPSHISIGIPELNDRGFKGTFFLPTNYAGTGDRPGCDCWSAAGQEHEIASHAISQSNLTTLSLTQAQCEMEGATAVIDAQIPAQKCLTFEHPSGRPMIPSHRLPIKLELSK